MKLKGISAYEKERAAERKEYSGYEKYEVESWADTLQRAAEIINDAKKMKAVSTCLEKKKKSIKTLEQLRALADGRAVK